MSNFLLIISLYTYLFPFLSDQYAHFTNTHCSSSLTVQRSLWSCSIVSFKYHKYFSWSTRMGRRRRLTNIYIYIQIGTCLLPHLFCQSYLGFISRPPPEISVRGVQVSSVVASDLFRIRISICAMRLAQSLSLFGTEFGFWWTNIVVYVIHVHAFTWRGGFGNFK